MSQEGHTPPPPERMTTDALISRSWNDTPIQRRTTDGFVNATAMCKANGKQWSHYRETDRTNGHLEKLPIAPLQAAGKSELARLLTLCYP